MLCGAVALAIVISAILYGAVNALDVLFATSLVSAIVHFDNRPFDIWKDPLFALRKSRTEDISRILGFSPTHILLPAKINFIYFF